MRKIYIGRPGPYYVRKSEGQDPKARVVSAVWTLLNRVKDVTELGLTWPSGNHRQASGERLLHPVVGARDQLLMINFQPFLK